MNTSILINCQKIAENQVIFQPSSQINKYKEINLKRYEQYIRTKNKNNNSQQTTKSKLNNTFKLAYNYLEKFWNKIVPISIRGECEQFQCFKQLWKQNFQAQIPKWVSKQSLLKFFQQKQQKQQIVIAICYTEMNYPQLQRVFKNLQQQKSPSYNGNFQDFNKPKTQNLQTKNSQNSIDKNQQNSSNQFPSLNGNQNKILFPILIQGDLFKQLLRSKLQYKKQSLVILHKNIFNQLIVLDQISFDSVIDFSQLWTIFQKQIIFQQEILKHYQSKQNIVDTADFSSTHQIVLKPKKNVKNKNIQKKKLIQENST